MNSSEASAQPKAPHVVSGESQIFSSPACLCKAQCILYFMLSVFISAVLHSGYQKCVCMRVLILGLVFSIVVVF